MNRAIICCAGALALGALLAVAHPSSGLAADRDGKVRAIRTVGSAEQTSGRYQRRRIAHPRIYAGRRIGFYSYTYRDVMSPWRDPYLYRQTQAGPFDSGFFFDSAILPRGGDSPHIR
jgi:hypothetical protein